MTSRDPSSPRPQTAADLKALLDGRAAGPALFRERLWPSPGIWSLSLCFGIMMWLAFLPVGFTPAVLVAVATAVAIVLLMIVGTPAVEVRPGLVRCGAARLDVESIGGVAPLDAEEVRHLRGPGFAAAAFTCQRGWLKTGVRIEVADGHDPTPFWFLSSRKPKALAAAVERARAIR
ncbi:DUF3093 domain-containing protein [Micrococcales bacterium 31B]|nr:DUF3093 domain-containing protein [Micrococcales bacterium 31B]